MTDEERKAAEEAAKNANPDVKKLLDEINAIKGNFNNVVNELQEERKKKQQAEAERDLAVAKANQGTTDVDTKIKTALSEFTQAQVQDNKKKAEEKFRNANKEFDQSNDPGGIKFAALQESLKRFSTEGLKTEDDFAKLYNDALILTKKASNSSNSKDYNPYASTPSDNGNPPKEQNGNDISSKEERLIKSLGWDKERYLKQKSRRPSYVQGLLDTFSG